MASTPQKRKHEDVCSNQILQSIKKHTHTGLSWCHSYFGSWTTFDTRGNAIKQWKLFLSLDFTDKDNNCLCPWNKSQMSNKEKNQIKWRVGEWKVEWGGARGKNISDVQLTEKVPERLLKLWHQYWNQHSIEICYFIKIPQRKVCNEINKEKKNKIKAWYRDKFW